MGVGTDNFDKVYQFYVSESQKEKLVSADTTEHPHNQFLFIMAEYGILAGVVWLWMVIKVLKSPDTDPARKALKISFLSFFVHGMLDKLLYVEPTSLIFMIMIPLLYPESKEIFIKQPKLSGLVLF